MELPPLKASTAATVHTSHALGMDGRVYALVVIKQRFDVTIKGEIKRAPDAEVRLSDELWDEENAAASSLKHSSDLALFKPATDIVVHGEAMSRGRVPQSSLEVLIRVGSLERGLRVLGTRVWYKGMTGLAITAPEPFESMPLKWDLAFGGRDDASGALIEEPRNPVGRGVVGDSKALIHKPLPNIEDPLELITSEKSKPTPAGAGPIMRHWAPRKAYAGTHDEAWLRERLPLPPLDFDPRHEQIAAPQMIYPGYLRGGERVSLYNLCEEGALQFELPKLSFFVGAQLDGELVEHRAFLDTVMLEPNELAFDMVWRAKIPMPARAHQLRAVQVHERKVLA